MPKVNISNFKKINRSAMDVRNSLQKPKDRERIEKSLKGQTEKQLQGLCEGYLTFKGILFLRIPDSVYRICGNTNIPHSTRNDIRDYLAGWPDLVIFTKDTDTTNTALFVELKVKGGRLSPKQKRLKKLLAVHVVTNFEQFKNLIDKTLLTKKE